MSKFKSKSSSSNDKMIEQQKKEAEKAERKEYDRQERLRAGRDRIKAMFTQGGGDYRTAGKYKKFGPSGGPKTITERKYVDNLFRNSDGGEGGWTTTSRDNPNYKAGGYRKVKGGTKTEAGLADDFYSNFKNSILDYFNPELERQHSEAKDANLFDLARRGMLRSSVATDNAAELVRERAEAEARIKADAENQTAGLRGDMSRAQQNAISLLQQTEDPTSAANAARTEVNAIQSRSPNFSPLGELFSAAARSFAGWQNAQNARRNYGGVPERNPYTSQGRNVG